MNLKQHSTQTGVFLDYLDGWLADLPVLPLQQAVPAPDRAAILSVDVINGFCYEGPLSSPRGAGIVEPIAKLFEQAWNYGVRHILLSQDTHEPEAVEFGQWPQHCVRGTSEAETVDAFKALPFFDQMVIQEKNSIHAGINTSLNQWIAAHPEIDTFIVVGDCTDLCTYQLAMHLRLDANARQIERRVIVPENCVQTYDLPVETALQVGAVPHPGDLMHAVFLYYMALNGVEIISHIS